MHATTLDHRRNSLRYVRIRYSGLDEGCKVTVQDIQAVERRDGAHETVGADKYKRACVRDAVSWIDLSAVILHILVVKEDPGFAC